MLLTLYYDYHHFIIITIIITIIMFNTIYISKIIGQHISLLFVYVVFRFSVSYLIVRYLLSISYFVVRFSLENDFVLLAVLSSWPRGVAIERERGVYIYIYT